MEKRDMIVIIVAIIIVLVMAMYIKPLVTGKEPKIIPDEISGIFGNKNESTDVENISNNETNFSQFGNLTDNPENQTNVANESMVIQNLSIDNISPIQPWNGTPVNLSPGIDTRQKIVPREYVTSYQPYSFKESAVPLKTYTTISGEHSQIIDSFFIPSKYWEIWYTVELPEDLQNPILEEQSDDENIVQSLSAVNPSFKIIVKNIDSNEIINTITPSGGLDPKLWKGTFGREGGELPFKEQYSSTNNELGEIETKKGDTIEINWDPRPWKEKFFDGYHNYSLNIEASFITSYQIEIKLPDPENSNKTIINQSGEINRETPSVLFEKVINYYIELYNSDFTIEPNRTEMINLFSSEITGEINPDSIISTLNIMKLSGVNITSFRIDDSFYRLDEGNVKGAFIWNKDNKSHESPYEILFYNENGQWKLNTFPIIRY